MTAGVLSKEQSLSTEEKSEYVDNLDMAKIDGVDKAQSKVQQEAEEISKVNRGSEAYLEQSKKQNTKDKYEALAESFKAKNEGMTDLQAQNAALIATARAGKMNAEFTEEVFTNNVKAVAEEKQKMMEQRAIETGAVSNNGTNLKQSETALQAQSERLANAMKNFDKYRNERGQLDPKFQMSYQQLLLTKDRIDRQVSDIKNFKQFKNSAEGREISMNASRKIDTLASNLKDAGVIKVDENGNIKYGTSFEGKSGSDLTFAEKVQLRQEKGYLDGNAISAVGMDGRRHEVVTDLAGTRITNFSSAKNGYSNTGEYNYDVTYFAGQTEFGQRNMKEIAIANTTFNTAKEAVSLAGFGKMLKK